MYCICIQVPDLGSGVYAVKVRDEENGDSNNDHTVTMHLKITSITPNTGNFFYYNTYHLSINYLYSTDWP